VKESSIKINYLCKLILINAMTVLTNTCWQLDLVTVARIAGEKTLMFSSSLVEKIRWKRRQVQEHLVQVEVRHATGAVPLCQVLQGPLALYAMYAKVRQQLVLAVTRNAEKTLLLSLSFLLLSFYHKRWRHNRM
jgi:hypothetical protein